MKNSKRCIKVSHNGETKRLKAPSSYESLAQQTREKFPGQGLEAVQPIKFYYLDDEQELIQITSTGDLIEALEIEDVTTLKLVVADNANDARQSFEKQIGDNMSMHSSINLQGSNMLNNSMRRGSTMRLDTMSENFQTIDKELESARTAENTNFMENMKAMFQNALSEVKSLVKPRTETQELKQDTPIVPAQEPVKIPDVAPEQIYTKLSGAPVEEKKATEQKKPIHKDFICDGCEMEPIVGTRYMATDKEDYDICEHCEAKGVGSQYTFLKIRKPEHAPVKFHCKYPTEQGGNQFPDAHFDINVEDIKEKVKSFCGTFMNAQGQQPNANPMPNLNTMAEMFIKNFGQKCGQTEAKPSANDFKMPEAEAPAQKEEPKPTVVTDFTTAEMPDEYQMEDESIVCDVTQNEIEPQPVGTITNLEIPDIKAPAVAPELKMETPKPVLHEELSKDEIYKLEASAENGYLRTGLLQLQELGFNQFQRNKELLQKFNLNIQAVASALLEDNELYE